MIERVLENWLTNASERSYQVPFCQALTGMGQKVIHSTRHCAMEMGKDIIAQDDDGYIHVYQLKSLKGRKLTQSEYRSDIAPQLNSLILGKPIHPSIPENSKVKFAYIVMSGDINEEASREIDDLNRTLEQSNILTRVKTITFGELISLFSKNLHKFGPREPIHSKLFLELFLSNGKDFLPKEKLFSLLEVGMACDVPPTKTQTNEIISSAALICSLTASNYQMESNWFAEFECWGVYTICLMQFSQKWELSSKSIQTELDIALKSMYMSLEGLIDECLEREENITEGNALADSLLATYRRSHLLGLASLYLLWSETIGNIQQEKTLKIMSFIHSQIGKIAIWGESCVPFIFSYILYCRRSNEETSANKIIKELITTIIHRNSKGSNFPCPSPYYSATDCISLQFSLPDSEVREDFTNSSYTLYPLILLMTQFGLRNELVLSET